jgi:acyl-CoA synthetase (AMP-forming)/AMP-acid ligase II
LTLVSDSAVDEQPEMGEIDVRNDTAGILFSSGTTGYPKAIPYSHAMIWERRSRLLKPKYKSVKNPEIV